MGLTQEEYRVLHYIRDYPEWINEIETLADSRTAIRYDTDRVQTSLYPDSIMELALKIEDYQERVNEVDRALYNAFKTDGKIQTARRVFCYNERTRIGRGQYYSWRRILAKELLEIVKEKT